MIILVTVNIHWVFSKVPSFTAECFTTVTALIATVCPRLHSKQEVDAGFEFTSLSRACLLSSAVNVERLFDLPKMYIQVQREGSNMNSVFPLHQRKQQSKER